MSLEAKIKGQKTLSVFIFMVVTLFTTSQVFAVNPVNVENGVALKGYDPIAYFQEGKPTQGNKEFEYEWMGAKWYFSSVSNLELFKQSPEKYAPQYGGYCAWAVSQGYTATIDPEAWKIVNDKLYLNYDKKVQKKWEQDVPGNIIKADKNWPNLLK